MEKATFLMDYLRITQKANSTYSHRGDKAIDVAGYDTGIDSLKAPFTGTIKRIYKSANVVWLQSNDKVEYADGTIDYMTVLTMHDNDISNLYVGKVIKQGEIYYQEGKKGNATGNHIHIAVGKGKFTGNGWFKNKNGNWCINNQIDIYNALYLPKTIKIKNDGGYNWKYLSNTVYYKKYTGKTSSIVDALKNINEDSSYKNREKIAKINGINNYTGTKNQNIKMLTLLKQGQLIKKA